MVNWDAFVEDKEYVIEQFKAGRFDYLEVASKVVEADFFRYFLDGKHFDRLAESYPTPRKKHDVPLWVYLSSQITLKLHGASGFAALPYILYCGGLVEALGHRQAQWREDEELKKRRLRFEGYNRKNHYERNTPCDQDYVRKLSRDTNSQSLQDWFSLALNRLYRDMDAFDSEGIFMIDGSYLFVPDNPNYEDSAVMWFDWHNHPISKDEYKKLTPKEQKRCRLRRCYRSVSLIHTDRALSHTLYSGIRVLPGKASETPQMGPLVDDVIKVVGKGVIKKLIFDRGFIDGPTISRFKTEYGIDTVFPLRKNMLDLRDAKILAEADNQPWIEWRPPPKAEPKEPEDRPECIRQREKKRQLTVRQKKAEEGIPPPVRLDHVELKTVREMKLWDACKVPICVVLMRDYMSDGTMSEWNLATTDTTLEGDQIRQLYMYRPHHEEGNRQMKCFWDLSSFRSCKRSLVTSQVVFVDMTYSLMQLFLMKSEREQLTRKTRERLLQQFLPEGSKVVIYCDNRVAYLRALEHQELLLKLSEGPRRKILGKTMRLRRQQIEPPELPLRRRDD